MLNGVIQHSGLDELKQTPAIAYVVMCVLAQSVPATLLGFSTTHARYCTDTDMIRGMVFRGGVLGMLLQNDRSILRAEDRGYMESYRAGVLRLLADLPLEMPFLPECISAFRMGTQSPEQLHGKLQELFNSPDIAVHDYGADQHVDTAPPGLHAHRE